MLTDGPHQQTGDSTGQRQQHRLGKKQGSNLRPAGAQRLEQTDLAFALRYRDQHHIHDQDPGNGQADGGDAADGQRQRTEDAVKGL